MTAKPKPGERMSDYLTRCVAESLRRTGASESEVSDFADILLIQCCDARTLTPSDALCYLESWREERRMIAGRTRELRAERRYAVRDATGKFARAQ